MSDLSNGDQREEDPVRTGESAPDQTNDVTEHVETVPTVPKSFFSEQAGDTTGQVETVSPAHEGGDESKDAAEQKPLLSGPAEVQLLSESSVQQPSGPGPIYSYSFSTIGKSHVSKNIPCQDSSGHMVADRYSIAVVSDGHSDYHCFRSDQGSRIAVDVALICLKEKLDGEGYDHFIYEIQNHADTVLPGLWKEILTRWRFAVAQFEGTNPVTEEEWGAVHERIIGKISDTESAEKAYDDVRNQSPYTKYGATLRVALQYDSGYLLLVLGDGESVVIGLDGSVSCPVPDDPDTVGSEVHSICEDNAFDYSKYYVGTNPVIGIGVCSDGIFCSDDESDNQYYLGEYIKGIFKEVDSCSDSWKEDFHSTVVEYSSEFPKDDCSVAFTVLREFDRSVLDTVPVPMEYHDDPIYNSVSSRFFFSRRRFGYAINSFDITCYRSRDGIEIMQKLVENFCDSAISNLTNALKEDREKQFFTNFKLLIQQWNRAVTDFDAKNPDSDAEREMRLTNNLALGNTSQKYGVSVALAIEVDKTMYTAFVGRGMVTIETSDGEKHIDLGDTPRSTSTISFKMIQVSADEHVRSVYVTGLSEVQKEIKLI